MTSSGAMTCPTHHRIRQPVLRPGSRKNTDLSLRADRHEEIHNGIFAGTPRSNNQQRAHSVKGTRLNEHGDNSLTQSANSGYPQGISSVSCVDDKPDDDHEGEEDVE